jgi:hypothetical protein
MAPTVLKRCEALQGADACKGLIPIILDVTQSSDIERAYNIILEWTQTNGKQLVGLVNNAGITSWGPVEALSLQTYRNGLCEQLLW